MFKSENEKNKKISKIIYHTLLRASFHKRNQVCQISVVHLYHYTRPLFARCKQQDLGLRFLVLQVVATLFYTVLYCHVC